MDEPFTLPAEAIILDPTSAHQIQDILPVILYFLSYIMDFIFPLDFFSYT